MNTRIYLNGKRITKKKFPSPTGVTYYELIEEMKPKVVFADAVFPSPTGVTYYELAM